MIDLHHTIGKQVSNDMIDLTREYIFLSRKERRKEEKREMAPDLRVLVCKVMTMATENRHKEIQQKVALNCSHLFSS